MLDFVDMADIHGQFKFNFKHAAISREDSKRFLDWAFWHDFEKNGPSLYRMCQTMLQGWQRYRDYPDPRVRERFAREMDKLKSGYNAALWAMEHQFREVNRSVSERIKALRKEVESESGLAARISARTLGPLLALDFTPRRASFGQGQNLRTPHIPGTHQLDYRLSSPSLGVEFQYHSHICAAEKLPLAAFLSRPLLELPGLHAAFAPGGLYAQ